MGRKRRDAVFLGPPKKPRALAKNFPRADGLPLDQWFRAHWDGRPAEPDRGCWWFASFTPPAVGEGRFDLPEPRGTCYFADDIEAAVRERAGRRWGTGRFLPPAALAGTTVSHVDLRPYTDGHHVADVDHRDAVGYVTRELYGGARYKLTQRHADAFDKAGFRALRYRPRSTPGDPAALALFGAAGRPEPPRPAAEVPDWRTQLRSKVRDTVKRSRATIIS
ncbi:MAG: RES family NAD+ phosphorylase [Micropruina sp.]|uniref:RES family NAD+ phosphorylase n=1 Tax=Micropruina sp. TaxID=2737536 RepID=UPI0039E4E4C9